MEEHALPSSNRPSDHVTQLEVETVTSSKRDELLHYFPCIVQFMLPTPQVSLVATFMFKEAHEHKAQVVTSESEYSNTLLDLAS